MGINSAKKMDIFYEYQWQKVLHQYQWTQKIINKIQEKIHFLKMVLISMSNVKLCRHQYLSIEW